MTIDLQWSDPYFTGRQFDFQTSQVRRFVFDTRNRGFRVLGTSGPPPHKNDSQNPADMDPWTAAQTASHTDANAYWVLYARYRHQWPVWVSRILFLLGEGAIVFWVRSLWRRSLPDSPDANPTGNLSLLQPRL